MKTKVLSTLIVIIVLAGCSPQYPPTPSNPVSSKNTAVVSTKSAPPAPAIRSQLDRLVYSENDDKRGSIQGISFSPDGALIVVSFTQGVGLFLAENLKPVWFLPFAGEGARFSKDGASIITGWGNSLFFYQTTDGSLVRKTPISMNILSFGLFPDENHLLVSNGDKDILLVNLENNREIKKSISADSTIHSYSKASENNLFTASFDQIIKWDKDGNKICQLTASEVLDYNPADPVWDIANGTDKNFLLVLRPNRIEKIDVCGKKKLDTVRISDGKSTCQIDTSGNLLVAACEQNIMWVRIDQLGEIFKEVRVSKMDSDGFIKNMKISPDNQRILLVERIFSYEKDSYSLILLDQNGNLVNQIEGFKDDL